MRKRWLVYLSWGVTLMSLLLVFTLPLQFRSEQSLLVLVYLLVLLVSLCAGLSALVLAYRKFFSSWLGWGLMLGLMISFHLLVSLPAGKLSPRLSLFVSLGMVAFSLGVGVASVLLLWRRDHGLPLLAWATVGSIWLILVGWRIQGSLIELAFDVMQSQNTTPLWWLNSLCCALGWVLPLGLFSFVGHTLKLIVWELEE